MDMPLHPGLVGLAFRLALTFVAGTLIGMERESRGHAAGLRTTLLVCLAASVAMMQANLLLPLAGKAPNGFSVMDLMRLPLGVLTGMGFIGGGAILKRGSLVKGVTTAATLWMATVIGLCLGGGQIGLGVAATLLTLVVLWGMRPIDGVLPTRHSAILTLTLSAQAGALELAAGGLGVEEVRLLERRWQRAEGRQVSRYEVCWRGPSGPLMDRLDRLANEPTVLGLCWTLVTE